MEVRFVTLQRNEKDFLNYLMGNFSKTELAIPVTSLNISTFDEKVTFEIIKKTEVKKPSTLRLILSVLRLRNLSVVLVPLLSVLSETSDLFLAMQIATAVSFLLLAANLRNDVQDHVRGFDRINTRSGSRVIQKGWATAYQLQTLSWVFLFLASILGLPILWNAPGSLSLVALSGLAVLLGLSSRESNLRFSLFSELTTFLLTGPLLVMAGAYAINKEFSLGLLFWSLSWGAWYTVVSQFRTLRQLMLMSEANLPHWMVKVGFDRSKLYLAILFVLVSILLPAGFVSFFTDDLYYKGALVFLMITIVRFGPKIFTELLKINSPLSSSIEKVNQGIQIEHSLISFILALYFISKIIL